MRIILSRVKSITYLAVMQRVEIMKRLKTVFFAFIFTFLNFSTLLAEDPPEIDDPLLPPREELPIDNQIVFLVVLAVVLGIAVIYRNRIKKASM
ncbi:hypothetical protein ACHRVZ_06655 [Flavobacterium sp. FlaQc-57]|uniref:hypothetical protein n=1 Tax=Flavobacterium sp. FlaQc-57 TaxID=3374186 RepID=UPI003756B992